MNKIIIQMFSWFLNFYSCGGISHNEIISNLAKNEFFATMGEAILRGLPLNGNESQKSSIRSLSLTIADFALTFIPKLISERISKVISEFILNEIRKFKSCIFKCITHYKWEEITSFSSKKDQLLKSFDFKRANIKYINSLVTRLTKFLLKSANKFRGTVLDSCDRSFFKFKQYVYDNLVTNDGYNHIPKNIDNQTWIYMITSLINNLKKAKIREWQVILPIGNLDCKGSVLKTGNVTIYDSRKWDFGDNNFMDSIAPIKININENFSSDFQRVKINPGNQILVRSSARAFIEVKALDEFHAFNYAKEQLLNALNSMVFMLDDEFNGFKPQFIKYFQVIDKQTNSSPAGFERPSIHMYEIFEIENSDIQLIKTIDEFLMRKSNIIVNKRILRSLEWYRSGRWDETENGRFVSYWISLEHLITALGQLNPKIRRRSKKEYLLFYIPKLISWRHTFANYNISFGYIDNIITKIKQDTSLLTVMDNDAKVNQWRNGYSILENLDYIQKLDGKSKLEDSIVALKAYLKENKNKIRKHRLIKRKQEKFRIAFLYLIRNSMFHDGILYSEERLAEFNPILRSILYNIIYVFMTRNFKSLSQVISYLNRPTNFLR
jgi:hypothetical protein